MQKRQKQKQDLQIHQIDLNEYLNNKHKYHTLNHQRQYSPYSRISHKLKMDLNIRAQTCLSIQTYDRNMFSARKEAINSQNIKESRNQCSEIEYRTNDYVGVINLAQMNQDKAKFIKSLNGTWFQQTNQDYKCSKMYNTLGIKKKNRFSVKAKGQIDYISPIKESKQIALKDKIDFTKQVKQPGVFPLRKKTILTRNSSRSPKFMNNKHYITINKHFQTQLKLQILKNIKNESQIRPVSRMTTTSLGLRNIKHSKDSNIGTAMFSNAFILNSESQPLVKGKKMKLYD